jgi:ATP-binding cassette subfamily B protein
MLEVGPPIAEGSSEGDLVARLVANTATAGRAVVLVAGLAATLVPPVGAVVALALIDPWLAVTFAVGTISVSGAVRRYLRDARAATVGYLEAQGEIANRLVDALAGARTIAAARTADREVRRVLTPLDELGRHGRAVWQNIARLAFRGEPVVLLTQTAVVAVAGVGVAAGRLTPGEMLAASRYAVMAAGIGTILDSLASLTRARAGADRLVELLGQPIVRYGRRGLPDGPGELSLVGVTAGFDGVPVVSGLDLVVPGGQAVALIGRSGTGKSLVAALAGRLCDPNGGEVRLDGVPLRELSRGALRRAVAYAFERPNLPGATVGDAIGFGVEPASPARIRQAARAARADPFVLRLPDGYGSVLADTPLSGGEFQRLGLARALAHDARLLVLDDATSSLDTATEAEIATALTSEMQGRTRLIVTHRLATAARADLVAWLDDGRIRACAPHHTLWSDPAYRALFRPPAATPATDPGADAPPPPGPRDRGDSGASELAATSPGAPPRHRLVSPIEPARSARSAAVPDRLSEPTTPGQSASSARPGHPVSPRAGTTASPAAAALHRPSEPEAPGRPATSARSGHPVAPRAPTAGAGPGPDPEGPGHPASARQASGGGTNGEGGVGDPAPRGGGVAGGGDDEEGGTGAAAGAATGNDPVGGTGVPAAARGGR